MVNVSAKDLGTGKTQGIAVTASSGLSENEVTRLVEEAEEHEAEDAAVRDATERRNKLEGLVYSTERTLEEFAAEIDARDRVAVESALEKARRSLADESDSDLEESIKELGATTYGMTEKLYAALGED